MRPRRLARAAALAVAVAGAGVPGLAQVAATPPVTDAQIAAFTKAGTASISGRVITVLPGDTKRYFKDWRVFLAPTIPYTHFFVYRTALAWAGNTIPAPQPDPRWLQTVRSTHTDDQGNFTFTGLPPGGYFAYTVVEVKDGRVETLYRQNYEQVGTTTYFGDLFGTFPDYGYVSRPYEHDYTCDTQGVVGGSATVAAGARADVVLGLFGQRNDGC